MKKIMIMLCLLLGIGTTVEAQNKALEKANAKMYKTKLKEFKQGGWKLSGNSKTIEVVLLEHYDKLNDPANSEQVGQVTRFSSLNAGKQMAYNNALNQYASEAGSTIRGAVESEINIDEMDAETEMNNMYAAFERIVEQEVGRALTESFTIIRGEGNNKQMEVFFIVNEDKAEEFRQKAFKRAIEESELAQEHAQQISDFVNSKFESGEL